MKVAVIGGGSVYTPELARGLIHLKDRLPVREFVLVDIPEGRERLEAVSGLVRRMFHASGLAVDLTTTEDRRRALEGAAFVVNQFRVGGLSARRLDETIPLRHGLIGQETTGPGGFAMALRSVPEAVAIARETLELAPDAWLVNFTNPSGLVTEAILSGVPGIRAVGLCNIPLILQRGVAASLGVPAEDVTLHMIGLNHLSWARLDLRGEDITSRILTSDLGVQKLVANIPGLDADDRSVRSLLALMRRLGRIPNPYLRYYLLPQAMFAEEARAAREGRGTRADEVMRTEKVLLERYRDPSLTEAPEELGQRGGAWYSEAAVMVMDALRNGGHPPQVVNTPNHGATPDMPEDAVLEVDAEMGPDGIHPVPHGALPPEMRGLMQAVKAYEELTIQAATTGDRTTALQALASHPLVPDLGTADALLSELLEAHRPNLRAFFPEDAHL